MYELYEAILEMGFNNDDIMNHVLNYFSEYDLHIMLIGFCKDNDILNEAIDVMLD